MKRTIERLLSLSIIFGVSLCYAFLRLSLLRYRWFDRDELEHLHAAYSIAHGLLLYRDFFELHGPLLYLLLTPLTKIAVNPFASLWLGRSLMALFFLGTLTAQWFMSPTSWTHGEKSLGLLMICSFTTFANKSLEIRPDVPAMMLFSVAIALGWRCRHPRGRWAMGLCVGVALAFSFKVIFGAAGLLLGLVFREWQESRLSSKELFRSAREVLLGMGLPFLGLGVYFAGHHAFKECLSLSLHIQCSFSERVAHNICIEGNYSRK